MPDLITRKNNLSREISVFLIVSVRFVRFSYNSERKQR